MEFNKNLQVYNKLQSLMGITIVSDIGIKEIKFSRIIFIECCNYTSMS